MFWDLDWKILKNIVQMTGIKESDTGLAPPALWDLAADKQTLQGEQPLQVRPKIFLFIWFFSHLTV